MNQRPLSRFSGLFWRFAILAFVLSFILPSSKFVGGMSDDAFIVWLARILWVAGLSAGLTVLFWLAGRLRARKGAPGPSKGGGAPAGAEDGLSGARHETGGKGG
ncbi:hypothetical protein TRIP_B330054 [uncultured Desulfatiglans sp.]|uniref:Uncharacterized protein n=1 Tax=Uncultured Desulfatiglans sp. TaxID=1748965 RepID=A0A653A7A0_UNCDX|nr:hypothetical protein TRIP_B330054 [uncultured Desulfatiglans sp.]